MQWRDEVHEEADNRMLVHAQDFMESDNDAKCIVIRTNDTDVVVLFLTFFEQFLQFNDQADFWIDFGLGDYRRFISIKRSYDLMGDSICLVLPFFHAFSGCDSTSSFYRKTKRSLFDYWMTYPKQEVITAAFQQLSWQPSAAVIESQFPAVEEFVAYSFGLKDQKSVDEARFEIFRSSSAGNLRELPPSQNSLKLHVLRSAYQSGWVWGNTLSSQDLPLLTDWGWKYDENSRIRIHWFKEDLNSGRMKLLELIKTCKCEIGARCLNCSCGKKYFLCLSYCNCKASCGK